MKGLIGKKVGMTQIFDESGDVLPVTLIEAGPCYVVQVKTVGTDGYTAVQLGFGEVKPKRLTGGQLGHLKRTDLTPLRYLREFRLPGADGLEAGAKLTAEVFEIGDRHAREGAGADQLPRLPHDRLTGVVPDLDRHA